MISSTTSVYACTCRFLLPSSQVFFSFFDESSQSVSRTLKHTTTYRHALTSSLHQSIRSIHHYGAAHLLYALYHFGNISCCVPMQPTQVHIRHHVPHVSRSRQILLSGNDILRHLYVPGSSHILLRHYHVLAALPCFDECAAQQLQESCPVGCLWKRYCCLHCAGHQIQELEFLQDGEH